MDQQVYHVNLTNNKAIGFKQLSLVIEIFDTLKIDYWIEYGTLLGAVREKTIIPWESEFDVGIWYNDFKKYNDRLIDSFEKLDFMIDFSSKDRIKLLHKNSFLGAYKIDIHTYHINDGMAYVSSDNLKKFSVNNFILKTHILLKLFDHRSKPVYMMSDLLNKIMSIQDEIPDDFILIPGRFNDSKSFKILIDEVEYDFDKVFLEQFSYSANIALKLYSIIPQNIRNFIIDLIERRTIKAKVTNDIQAFPIHYFQNLTKIQFGNLFVSCPEDYMDYVRNVYGKDWDIKNPKWDRSHMKINRKME